MLMKHVILLLSILLLAPSAAAQKHVYDDLLVLYVDEEYTKCIAKAERYTERDDTKRDPLPYLYLSMCHHEMSLLEEYQNDPEYRHAERDALKYAVRFRKKDKHNEFYPNYEDFFMALNERAMESGLNHYEMGDFSKARRVFDRMVDYMPENAGAWRMKALCQERLRLARDAEESLQGFQQAYSAIPDIERLPKDQRQLLRRSLILHAEHMLSAGRTAEAREVMALGEDNFMSNAEFKALHKELN